MNLSLLLDMAADDFGDRIIVGQEDGIPARRLGERAVAAAAGLQAAEASALIHLAVNGPALPVSLFAAARARVSLVPLNYRLGRQQFDRLLANHQGAHCIADPAHAPAAIAAGLTCQAPDEFLSACNGPTGEVEATEPREIGAAAVLIYTSGTT